MSARSDAPVVKQAWAHASRLSTDGLLHDAVMEFLRIRTLLQGHNQNLQGSRASSGSREGPGGNGARATQTAGAQAAVGASPVQARVRSVIIELLAKVDEEIKSHMQFLQGNYYAALQLPAPQDSNRSSLRGSITDRVVKDNYRRLALRFHPDKTGEADSSSLFTIVRTAYENLATLQHRAVYQPALRCSTFSKGGGGDFRWEVEMASSTSERVDLAVAKFSCPATYARLSNPLRTKKGSRPMKRNQCGNHQHENSPAGGDCVGTPAMGASREGPWRRQGVRQSSKDDAEEGEGQEQEVRLGVEVETQKQILKYDEEEKEEEEEEEEEEDEDEEEEEDEEDEEAWEWEEGGGDIENKLLGNHPEVVGSRQSYVDAKPNQRSSRPRVKSCLTPSVDGRRAGLDIPVPAIPVSPPFPLTPALAPQLDQQRQHTNQRDIDSAGARGKSTGVAATVALGAHPPSTEAVTTGPLPCDSDKFIDVPTQFELEESQKDCPTSVGEFPRLQGLSVGGSCNDRMVDRDGDTAGDADGCGGCGAVESGSRYVQLLRKSVAARESDYSVAVCQSPAHAHLIQQEVNFWVWGAKNTKGQRGDVAVRALLLGDDASLAAVERRTCRRESSSSSVTAAAGSQLGQDPSSQSDQDASVPGRRLTTASTLGTVGYARSGCVRGGGGVSEAPLPARSSTNNALGKDSLQPPCGGRRSAPRCSCRRRAAADPVPENGAPVCFFNGPCRAQDAAEGSCGTKGEVTTTGDHFPTFPTEFRDDPAATGFGGANPRWDARPPWWVSSEKEMPETDVTAPPENTFSADGGGGRRSPLDTSQHRIVGDRFVGKSEVVEVAGKCLAGNEESWEEGRRSARRVGTGKGWFWGAPRDR